VRGWNGFFSVTVSDVSLQGFPTPPFGSGVCKLQGQSRYRRIASDVSPSQDWLLSDSAEQNIQKTLGSAELAPCGDGRGTESAVFIRVPISFRCANGFAAVHAAAAVRHGTRPVGATHSRAGATATAQMHWYFALHGVDPRILTKSTRAYVEKGCKVLFADYLLYGSVLSICHPHTLRQMPKGSQPRSEGG
jgi:hypothetical protein